MTNQPMSKQAQVNQLLAAVRRRLRQAVEVRVGHLGLSGQQYWMLETISERGECALGEVLSTLPMDQPTASRVLAALYRRGLVEIESDQHDRRRRCLRLTGAGKRLASRCAGHGQRVRKSVLVGFASEEINSLTDYLSRMVANLDRLDTKAPPAPFRGKGLAKPRVSGNYRAKP
jgi:MarR family transcriptional regulator, transcriptional regulator for hemolysin